MLSASAQATSVAERYLFESANAERAQRGLPVLRWDAPLYQAASAHAQQMAARQSISHGYEGEPDLAQRGNIAGAKFNLISETVAEAPTAVPIHDAWMNSSGHRANLLDPQVNAVGISVLRRNGQLYAVEDFERSVDALSFSDQEEAVARLISIAGLQDVDKGSDRARRTCSMSTGYDGNRQPLFVVRYTAGDLSRLPDTLLSKIVSGHYRAASVGACATPGSQTFASYSIAVMLFP